MKMSAERFAIGQDMDVSYPNFQVSLTRLSVTQLRFEIKEGPFARIEIVDIQVAPLILITALVAGVDTSDIARFPQWFDWTPLTWPFNLSRQPEASVPCGFVEGLPIGL
jgi:Asp-tRNA(Asn)/Glu-tRNA(Gln) amidotransferase A subunit family amidase